MDGVPGLSFHGIAPGETFTYRFHRPAKRHVLVSLALGVSGADGLYGALVIEPREPEPFAYDREHVVLLSDWTDGIRSRCIGCSRRTPTTSTSRNVRSATLRATRSATASRHTRGAPRLGAHAHAAERPRRRSGAAYTYLMNGHAPAANWTGLFNPGERVRLRLINGSAMSTFDVRIPGPAADGRGSRRPETFIP